MRSDGQVQFVILKPWMQILCLVILLGGLSLMAYTIVNITFKDELLTAKDRRMYKTRLDYEDRIAQMRARIDKLNTKLLLSQDQYLEEVDKVREEYHQLVERQKALSSFLRKNWGVKPTKNDRSKKDANKEGGLGEPWKGKRFATHRALRIPLDELRGRFALVSSLQASLLDDFIEIKKQRIAKAGKILKKFSVSATALADGSSYKPENAIGGPFIDPVPGDDNPVSERVALIRHYSERLAKIVHEAKRLPLSLPMRSYTRISSRFGLRRDPFRRIPAMHAGIDFKAPYSAPILATAKGVVVKAGWEGAYGRLVEIRHLNGISTRYAHLSKILVKPGQRVRLGTRIGRLGNTGRSTGAHLHYETRINGRAINPARFWKARNALQRLQEENQE